MNSPESLPRVHRVRHELRMRTLPVTRVARPTPGFVSVTFGGDELAGFTSAGFDDHVKLILRTPAGEEIRRDYTPRRFDAARGELTIEFALHDDGPATDWARQARPGDRVTIGGPRGSMVVAPDYDWHLLAGDATALPAISRRLEELPAGAHAIVVVALADAADRREFGTQARASIHWVAGTDALVATLRAVGKPAGSGYAWAAGEAGAMRQVRAVLIDAWQQPRGDMRVAGYWRQGAAGFHEELDR